VRTMKSAGLIRELEAVGWVLDRVRGSHHVFKHPGRPGHVVVPHPKKDLGIGLVTPIRQQAGLWEEG
jgi:predicted RNA binding protein YcfA (HicA-like mRNA interferase family)